MSCKNCYKYPFCRYCISPESGENCSDFRPRREMMEENERNLRLIEVYKEVERIKKREKLKNEKKEYVDTNENPIRKEKSLWTVMMKNLRKLKN